MKYIQKFENNDYLSQLAKEKKLREDFLKSKDDEIENLRKNNSGNYLPELIKDKKVREGSNTIKDRKEIVNKVLDFLVNDLNKKPGFESFKEELISFLNEFPKE